jgi:glycerate 2-kinase
MPVPSNDSDPHAALRRELTGIYRAAIAAVDPARLIDDAIGGAIPGCTAIAGQIAAAARIFAIAIGKASAAMASALERRLAGRIAAGLAVIPATEVSTYSAGRIQAVPGGHPLPTAESEAAGRAVLAMLAQARREDLVIVALSGGASAMFAAPAAGVTLEDKVAVTSALLRSGATIREINTVRKHLSSVKGGQLARAARGARVISLVLSDVPGNDLATIGSGPTVADPTTYGDAISALKRRRIWGRTPEPVREHLERGAAGEIAETPKSGDPVFARCSAAVIGDNATALDAAERHAHAQGWTALRWSALAGEADQLGRTLASRLASIYGPRVCVLAGGEPVVTVRGSGRGGRAQQAALAMALEMDRASRGRKIAGMFAGTDGIDGPTDAAGGFAFSDTVARAAALGLDAHAASRANDAYNLLDRTGDLVRTGPTGTNVADIFIGLANY